MVNEKTNELKLAPIYGCGSCLFSQLTDKQMEEIISSKNEIDIRVYDRPLSSIKINNKKINYNKFITTHNKVECNNAIMRIVPRINIEKINNIIDTTPFITEIRKEFYRVIIKNRFEKILQPVYLELKDKIDNNEE